jgi:hypothetical protein
LELLFSGDSARNLPHSIYNIYPLVADEDVPDADHGRRQNVLTAVLLTLLPGIIQHEGYLPSELGQFVGRISRSSVLRKGAFFPSTVQFPPRCWRSRVWHKKSLFIAVANFSFGSKETVVNLARCSPGSITTNCICSTTRCTAPTP